MKFQHILATSSVVLAMALATSIASAAAPSVKPHHQKAGLSCTACHIGGGFKAVQEEQCLTCHVSRDAVAAKTEQSEHNPHYGHGDPLACNACHFEHKPSVYSCEECHLWEVKTP